MKINVLQKIIGCGFAAGILIFTGIMATKVLPYLTFERALNFLGTKPDSVLDRTYFMWAFYVHITTSLVVMFTGIFQFFPFSSPLRRERGGIHRLLGKIYIGAILLFAAPSGLVLAAFANGGLAAKVGFSLQCLVWWALTAAAWTSYKNKSLVKPVIWAADLFRFANDILKDFSIGERDVEINKQYRSLGWDDFYENNEWWNKAEKPKM